MSELDVKTTTAQELGRNLIDLCGEENVAPGRLDDGDPFFAAWLRGVPMMFYVESFGEEPVFIDARHTVGAGVQNMEKARTYLAARNQSLSLGRLEFSGDDQIDFTFQLFAASLNKETIRWVLRLLMSEAERFPELAEATGALKLTDFLALQQNQEE